LGFLISFTGVITFSRDYDKVIKSAPLDKIMIETDAPFVAPVPYRESRNEPFYVKYVAEKIAELDYQLAGVKFSLDFLAHYDTAKKSLAETGVKNRNKSGQKINHRDAAQKRLQDNRPERKHAQPFEPGPFFGAQNRHHEPQGEQPHRTGYQTMGMLKADSADHGREKTAVRKRPIGHGKAGPRAGHETSGNDQKVGSKC